MAQRCSQPRGLALILRPTLHRDLHAYGWGEFSRGRHGESMGARSPHEPHSAQVRPNGREGATEGAARAVIAASLSNTCIAVTKLMAFIGIVASSCPGRFGGLDGQRRKQGPAATRGKRATCEVIRDATLLTQLDRRIGAGVETTPAWQHKAGCCSSKPPKSRPRQPGGRSGNGGQFSPVVDRPQPVESPL